jgi:protein-tyrosine kinase
MGKLQDALDKVRAAESGSTRSVRRDEIAQKRIERDDGCSGFNGPSPLERFAQLKRLDEEWLQKQRVIAAPQADAAVTAYKMLRTRSLQRLRANDWRRIAVSSARRNAGKTLTAVNTAISLSSEPNQYVILVDLDLRRPSVAKTLGIEHSAGISEFLSGRVKRDDLFVRTEIERLLIVPNFERLENSSEMMTSGPMLEFIDEVSSPVNSTVVIFDLPPLLEADDLLAISPHMDALLLVVAEGETKRLDFQRSLGLIENLEVLGFVLNKSRGETVTQGYYY